MNKFFKVAEAIANTSLFPRVHIGACLVKKKAVISVGVNSQKSHPLQKRYNKFRNLDQDIHHFLHAELDALIRTNEDLTGAEVFVFRRNRRGELAIARPCAACAAALIDRGIKKVHYTTDIGIATEVYD